MVKHHSVVGRYVTIEVDDCEYKVFYLQNGKGIPLILFGGKKFKKHYMWTRKGKKYCAKTYKQHLRGVRKGHTHKKPRKR